KRSVRVEDDGDPRDTRPDLLEQLQPFSHQRWVISAEPRDVAAWPREALNKALADGIAHAREDDRYRAHLLLRRRARRGARCAHGDRPCRRPAENGDKRSPP